jgi:hypothetical protein
MQSVGDITQALDNERDVCHLLTMDIDTTLRLAYTVSKRDVYRYPAGYVFLRICIRPPENFIPMA